MNQTLDIESALSDPRLLEQLYRKARQTGAASAFATEINRRYAAAPDNVLLAAWYHRLQQDEVQATSAPSEARRINWLLAVPLGLVLAVIYWPLLAEQMVMAGKIPYFLFLWAPLAAGAIVAYLVFGSTGRLSLTRSVIMVVIALALAGYVVWLGQSARQDYRIIGVIHLPLLAWIAIGFCVAGPGSNDRNRFAFLIKSTEAVVTGGIYAGAAGLFLAITTGIFDAIGIHFSEPVMRLLAAGAVGLVPVLAVATVYDPRFAPVEQRFDEGLGKLISTLGRFFLPLTLMVGIVYVLSIPFNFWRPFEQREVLIVYNLMLFAVMGLLVFATPIGSEGLSQSMQAWLRRGILAVAALTVLVSLYALSATLYRTWTGSGLTINRLTIIGWNLINIGILVHLLYTQARSGRSDWLLLEWRTCRYGMIAYTVWTVFLLVAIPWLFPA